MDLFPHEPRLYQEETVHSIRSAVREGREVLFQAPTGFGKTPVILTALLPLNKRILWLSRTGNQVNRPVEELAIINDRRDQNFSGVSFRGKRDMCMGARRAKAVDYEAINAVHKDCPRPKGLLPGGALTFSEVYNRGISRDVCPYNLQKDLSASAKLLSMSYNYVFNDMIHLLEKLIDPESTVMVVDEAHNFQRAGDFGSDKLTLHSLRGAFREAQSFHSDEAYELAASIKKLGLRAKNLGGERELDPAEVLKQAGVEKLELARSLAQRVYEKQMRAGRPIRSHLNRFAEFWYRAKSGGSKGIAFLGTPGAFEIVDMRVAEALSHLWDRFHSTILMSGTLKPIDDFATLVGLDSYDRMEVPSFASSVYPFVVRGVSTRGKELHDRMRERYEFLLENFLTYPRNSAIFTASYRIQSEFEDFVAKACDLLGKQLFVEERGLRGDEARQMLTEFKKSRSVLMAPMGGRFAEGADFPGKSLEAILLLGVPFDRFTLKARLSIEYHRQKHGDKGRYFAYTLPAIRRASQALGRAVRGPTDMGFFVLADERYARYKELLPDYVERNLKKVHHSNFPLVMRGFHTNS